MISRLQGKNITVEESCSLHDSQEAEKAGKPERKGESQDLPSKGSPPETYFSNQTPLFFLLVLGIELGILHLPGRHLYCQAKSLAPGPHLLTEHWANELTSLLGSAPVWSITFEAMPLDTAALHTWVFWKYWYFIFNPLQLPRTHIFLLSGIYIWVVSSFEHQK